MRKAKKPVKPTAAVQLETEIENLSMKEVEKRRSELVRILRTHRDPFVLAAVIRALSSSEKVPLKVFRDATSVVREHAALTDLLVLLGDKRDMKAAPILRKFATHPPPTFVRGAAIGSLGLLGRRRDLSFLKKLEPKETSGIAKASLLAAMYRLGDEGSLEKLLRMLTSRNYRVRCRTANLVAGLNLKEASARVRARSTLKEALSRENTVAARSSLAAALKQL